MVMENAAETMDVWMKDLAEVLSKAAVHAADSNGEVERTHTEIQGWLRDVGQRLGYDGWIAANNGGRADNGVRFYLETIPIGETRCVFMLTTALISPRASCPSGGVTGLTPTPSAS